MQFRTSNAKRSSDTSKASRCEIRCGKGTASRFGLAVFLLGVIVSVQARPQEIRYVYDGKSLRVTAENTSKCTKWQIWLYERGVRIPQFAASLQYSRWGVIEGPSFESTAQQLERAQKFEEAYANFFGPNSWGRYTFFNPLGPIAVMERATESEQSSVQTRSQLHELDDLRYRLDTLISAVQPSLENNESQGPSSPHREYFDGIRHAAEHISRLYSHLARVHHTGSFIQREIVSTRTALTQTEHGLREMTATLPSVKLPASTSWMFHTEKAGSDGTIEVQIRETGPEVSVHQAWTGGDGSMTGTVIETIIPFNDIGKVDLWAPARSEADTWAVRVQPAHASFPQTVTSPVRITPKKVFPAVNLTTTEDLLHLVFPNPNEARDAYDYFLYHQQKSR